MGVWLSPKEIATAAQVAKESRSSVYVTREGNKVRVVSARGREEKINQYGAIVPKDRT